MSSLLTFPVRQQLHHPCRRDPLYTKELEDQTPQFASHFIVDKKMIYGLPSSLIHTTPIHHNDVPFPQVIQVKIFSSATVRPKKTPLLKEP